MPGWIPSSWRDDRLVYVLEFEQGHWVDITHGDTIAAVDAALREELFQLGVDETLTLSEITGRNREITTLIATWIREQILEDGSYPLGIRFPSKHGASGQGHGYCWAFWLRRADVGLTGDPVKTASGTVIALENPSFTGALRRHGIESR